MSRVQQDSVIDDDEETCPLCIEEFDLGDKNFRPCPCGYQICQFCFNSLKNTYDKSTCPNCRRPYDEKTIQYKIPTAEDIKQDLANKNRKQIAAKRKETEKREVETSSRRNLAGVRVKQQNLVYVIGLVPTLKDEQQLLQTLRGEHYFGQYGEIEKIVVSKAKSGAANQGIGVYVTYARKEDAAMCINTVDGSLNGDRVLRAQYGTTKYCSTYLRGETCNNRNCTFLHESGEDGQNSSLQNEPSGNKRPTTSTQPSYSQPAARQASTTSFAGASSSQLPRPQGTRDDSSGRKGSTDGSALPTTASWATKEAQQAMRARRESQTNSRSSPSPQVTNATIVQAEGKRKESATPPITSSTKAAIPIARAAASQASSGKSSPKPSADNTTVFDDLFASVNSPDFRFIFDDTTFSKDELAAIYRLPTLIDPFGGAKRRILREKQASERAKLEAEAQDKLQATAASTIDAIDDEHLAGGSYQLGGEPEESSRNTRRSDAQSAIGQPSSNQLQANNAMNDQFANLNIDGRSLTPHQRQQLALLSSANVSQGVGLNPPTQTGFSGGGFDPSDQRSGLFANQHMPYEGTSNHGRQSSRFSFANDTTKSATNVRYNQQQGAPSQQQHFYPSGVQGPPPGLKASGTPPISGGGMFAQGHGFTSNMNSGFGATKESNDMFLRGRSATGSGHDASKRKSLLCPIPHRSPSLSSAPSLLTSLYGSMPEVYPDSRPVKQNMKRKKHKHADASSTGGVIVDLADPSILQARLHQSGAVTGQGMFGGQSQDDPDFPPPGPPSHQPPIQQISRFFPTQVSLEADRRSGTPKVPPGLSLPHAHPDPSVNTEEHVQGKASMHTSTVVMPALPLIPTEQHSSTPAHKPSQPEKKISSETPTGTESQERAQERSLSRNKDYTNTASPLQKTTKVDQKTAKPAELLVREVQGEVKAKGPDHIKTPIRQAKPQKIDLSAIQSGGASLINQDALKASSIEAPLVATPLSMSRPGTPGTGISKASDPSSVSRPRTLRLTTTTISNTKGADVPPPSATTEKSSGLPAIAALRDHSRQPSVSSISRSRPSSPAVSEWATSSLNVSRAGSPPLPSIVGSAPEKSKSKNQLKKERKAKAKESLEEVAASTATSQKSATLSTPAAEDIGPIVSRQKKKKKPQDNMMTASTAKPKADANIAKTAMEKTDESSKLPQSHTAKKGRQLLKNDDDHDDDFKSSIKDSEANSPVESVLATPAPVETIPASVRSEATRPYVPTLGDFYTDLKARAAASPGQDAAALVPDLLEQYVSDAPALLARMFQSGQLDPNSALFNPPGINSYRINQSPVSATSKGSEAVSGSSKRFAAYELTFGPQGSFSGQYAPTYPFGTITLTNIERKALLSGQPIRVHDADHPSDIYNRVLITPRGTVYRHMSAEEEEKILQLESRMDESDIQDLYSSDSANEDGVQLGEYENLRGGLDDLIQRPAAHGIVWVSTGSSGGKRTQGRRKADQAAQPSTTHAHGDIEERLSTPTAVGKTSESSKVEAENEDQDQHEEAQRAIEFSDGLSGDEDSECSDFDVTAQQLQLHTLKESGLPIPAEDILAHQSPTHAAMNSRFGGPDVFATNYRAVQVHPSEERRRGHGRARENEQPQPRHLSASVMRSGATRTMDVNALMTRIQETKAEMDSLRKELEAQEKKVTRRSKDVVKWRDAILNAAAETTAAAVTVAGGADVLRGKK